MLSPARAPRIFERQVFSLVFVRAVANSQHHVPNIVWAVLVVDDAAAVVTPERLVSVRREDDRALQQSSFEFVRLFLVDGPGGTDLDAKLVAGAPAHAQLPRLVRIGALLHELVRSAVLQ